jgi:amphi-Trp domain-containing protein
MSREEAAARLRAIADELASGNDIILERGQARFVAKVPDEVALKIEFEVEDDKTEFEIELTWSPPARRSGRLLPLLGMRQSEHGFAAGESEEDRPSDRLRPPARLCRRGHLLAVGVRPAVPLSPHRITAARERNPGSGRVLLLP